MKQGLLATLAIAILIAAPVAIKLAQGGHGKEVEVERAQRHALNPSILASGTLIYQSEVTLVPEVIGRVKELLVKEGDRVKAGQLLLRIDPATYLADTARLQAQKSQSELNIEHQKVTLRTAEAKWQRYKTLRAQGIVDASTYEDITSQRDLGKVELDSSYAMLNQTEAQLKQAQEQLAKTEIRSPIDGTVTAVYIKAGETAVPSAMSIAGSELMVVADTASVYAEVNVDETDVAKVGVNQSARIVPAAFPDADWEGEVEQVAISPRKAVGAQSKTYAVKIRLNSDPSMQFRPGMSCRAEISTRAREAGKTLAVPVQAVQYEDAQDANDKGKSVLYVSDGDRVRRSEVRTGATDDTYIEITDGIREGEQIVVGPSKTLRFLRDSERIVARAATPPALAPSAAGAKGVSGPPLASKQ